MNRGVVLALLTASVGCGGTSPHSAAAPSAASAIPPPPNLAPAEATLQTAGGGCETVANHTVGRGSPGATSLGFGVRGGLVAWRDGEHLVVRPVDHLGRPTHEATALETPFQVAALLASDAGFLVITQGRHQERGSCAARCPDATCAGWSGPGVPQVCTMPCRRPCMVPGPFQIRAQAVSLDGAAGEVADHVLGMSPVTAISGGDEGRIAMITADARWLALTHRGTTVRMHERQVELRDSVLPVRGHGPPAFLTGASRALDMLVTGGSSQPIASDAKVLDFTGMLVDARLQARYGPDGRVHVAWVGWLERFDYVGYAVLDGGRLQFVGEQHVLHRELQPPFGDYLSAWMRDDVLHRETWLQGEVDDGVSLGDVRDASVAWSGEALVAAYRTDDGIETRALRCRGGTLGRARRRPLALGAEGSPVQRLML